MIRIGVFVHGDLYSLVSIELSCFESLSWFTFSAGSRIFHHFLYGLVVAADSAEFKQNWFVSDLYCNALQA